MLHLRNTALFPTIKLRDAHAGPLKAINKKPVINKSKGTLRSVGDPGSVGFGPFCHIRNSHHQFRIEIRIRMRPWTILLIFEKLLISKVTVDHHQIIHYVHVQEILIFIWGVYKKNVPTDDEQTGGFILLGRIRILFILNGRIRVASKWTGSSNADYRHTYN